MARGAGGALRRARIRNAKRGVGDMRGEGDRGRGETPQEDAAPGGDESPYAADDRREQARGGERDRDLEHHPPQDRALGHRVRERELPLAQLEEQERRNLKRGETKSARGDASPSLE